MYQFSIQEIPSLEKSTLIFSIYLILVLLMFAGFLHIKPVISPLVLISTQFLITSSFLFFSFINFHNNFPIMLNLFVQAVFLSGISLMILILYCPPFFYLLNYGKTLTTIPSYQSWLYVPKGWFTHFYVMASVLSLMNLFLISFDLPSNWKFYIDWLSSWYSDYYPEWNYLDPQTCWILAPLIAIHAIRRTYECYFVSTFNKNSKMNITHYLIGVFFYAALNVCLTSSILYNSSFNSTWDFTSIPWEVYRDPKNIILTLMFLYFQYSQFSHHVILRNTEKYHHPTKRLFKIASCPHYFDENCVYFTINCIIFANNFPHRFNLSFLIIELWVIINLSISATNSHRWYKEQKAKDNKEFVAKYIIFPYVY